MNTAQCNHYTCVIHVQHKHMHTYIHTYTHPQGHIHVHTYTYAYTHMHTHRDTCTHTHTRTHTHNTVHIMVSRAIRVFNVCWHACILVAHVVGITRLVYHAHFSCAPPECWQCQSNCRIINIMWYKNVISYA